MYVWVLVVMLYTGHVEPLLFDNSRACNEAREEIIHTLSQSGEKDPFTHTGPYGSVSPCVKVPVSEVPRSA